MNNLFPSNGIKLIRLKIKEIEPYLSADPDTRGKERNYFFISRNSFDSYLRVRGYLPSFVRAEVEREDNTVTSAILCHSR